MFSTTSIIFSIFLWCFLLIFQKFYKKLCFFTIFEILSHLAVFFNNFFQTFQQFLWHFDHIYEFFDNFNIFLTIFHHVTKFFPINDHHPSIPLCTRYCQLNFLFHWIYLLFKRSIILIIVTSPIQYSRISISSPHFLRNQTTSKSFYKLTFINHGWYLVGKLGTR